MAIYFVQNNKVYIEKTTKNEDTFVDIPKERSRFAPRNINNEVEQVLFGYDRYAINEEFYSGIYSLNNKQYKR